LKGFSETIFRKSIGKIVLNAAAKAGIKNPCNASYAAS